MVMEGGGNGKGCPRGGNRPLTLEKNLPHYSYNKNKHSLKRSKSLKKRSKKLKKRSFKKPDNILPNNSVTYGKIEDDICVTCSSRITENETIPCMLCETRLHMPCVNVQNAG